MKSEGCRDDRAGPVVRSTSHDRRVCVILYQPGSLKHSSQWMSSLCVDDAAGVRAQEWVPDPVLTRAMDVIMILHMDHEQNASTSTVRVAGSSQANPYACIAAGIACLWGPAHGGANEAVRATGPPYTRAPLHTHTHIPRGPTLQGSLCRS